RASRGDRVAHAARAGWETGAHRHGRRRARQSAGRKPAGQPASRRSLDGAGRGLRAPGRLALRFAGAVSSQPGLARERRMDRHSSRQNQPRVRTGSPAQSPRFSGSVFLVRRQHCEFRGRLVWHARGNRRGSGAATAAPPEHEGLNRAGGVGGMKKSGAILLLVSLAAVFVGGIAYLFHLEFAGGDVYPTDSTLRSDPAGAELIFDSVRRLPGLTAVRNYQPILRLLPDRDSTILMLGIDPRPFAVQPAEDLREFEKIASRGNRLVLGMRPGSGRAPPRHNALERNWGVRFGLDFEKEGNAILYFAEADHWDVLERSGPRPVVVERAFGKGSIALVAAGWLFSNKSVAEARHTALLARIIGSHTRGCVVEK